MRFMLRIYLAKREILEKWREIDCNSKTCPGDAQRTAQKSA
jgi:hypothetical protein